MEVSLFPLHTVLYPGGPLPLRIFEKRYLDMISRCMKSDSPFGVLLIKEGSETGTAETCDVGTLAKITDWYQGSDGLLGVTAVGQQRFRVGSARREADGLFVGEVDLLPMESACPLPEKYQPLAEILSGVLDDLGRLYEDIEKNYGDAGWISYRYAEILPITPPQKQYCLESDDPIERLESMRAVLETVRL
jgi:Lon protease-like protein